MRYRSPMKKLMLLSASGVALVLCALNASAKEVVFNPTVPNEDGTYCWTNGQNWVGGAVPAAGDIVVFSPSDDLTVKRPTSGNIGGMRFEAETLRSPAVERDGDSASTRHPTKSMLRKARRRGMTAR